MCMNITTMTIIIIVVTIVVKFSITSSSIIAAVTAGKTIETAAHATTIATATSVNDIESFIVSASEATLLTPPTYYMASLINELSDKDNERKRNAINEEKLLKGKVSKMVSNATKSLYEIVQITTNCSRNQFFINVELNRPFHGVMYTKDFSYNECRSRGTSEKNISLQLRPSGCGVRVESHSDDNLIELTVHVMIQIEEKLRQSTDLMKTIKCVLPQSAMGLTLATATLTSRMRPGFRNGRAQHKMSTTMIHDNNKNNWNYKSKMKIQQLNDVDDDDMGTINTTTTSVVINTFSKGQQQHGKQDEQDDGEGDKDELLNNIDVNVNQHSTSNHYQYTSSTPRVRIWLELVGPDGSGSVMVGQATTLTIRAIVPGTIGVRIVDCAALDGLGESTQQLLDDRGCPIDEQVMPGLQMNYRSTEEGWSKQDDDDFLERTYTTTFPAFKFPDRERLHVTCGVQLCNEQCSNVNCRTDDILLLTNDLARIDVFNSLAVTAPQIEMDRLRYAPLYNMTVIDYPTYVRPLLNDGILCLSASKLAISFCILGLIFLTAVIVAVLSLIRSRKRFIHYRIDSSSCGRDGTGTTGVAGSCNAFMTNTNNSNRLFHRTEVCTSMFSSSSDSTQSPIRFGSKLFIPYYPNTLPYGRVY